MHFSALLVSLVAPILCCAQHFNNVRDNVKGPQHRIVGGQAVYITQYPHHVTIEVDDRYFCGGSILASRWVLTSAHCCDKLSNLHAWLKVRAGTDNRGVGGQVRDIETMHQHPKFDKDSRDYDVCAVRLKSAFNFDNTTEQIAFPFPPTPAITMTDLLFVSGFGKTTVKDHNHYINLVAAKVSALPLAECKFHYQYYPRPGFTVTDRMMCAGDRDIGACKGDSGDALIREETDYRIQVGVVTFPDACAHAEFPGVYTSLLDEEVNSFIRETVYDPKP